MKRDRLVVITLLALIAFAGNSILCRLALTRSGIDFASFTAVRLVSGALMLWLVVALRHHESRVRPSWLSALALFAYAAAFSFAYTALPAGTGALLLFGAVQATMIILGFLRRERLHPGGWAGFIFALGGLIALSWPGISTPPLIASVSMISAGIAWGVYSIRGQASTDPLRTTFKNFASAVLLALLLCIFLKNRLNRSLRDISGTGPSADKVEFVSGDRMDPISFKSEAISALLINEEEENTQRPPDLYAAVDANGVRQKVRPEIRLNLLLLFVAQFKEYAHSLTYLSAVIRHFQNDSVFTRQSAPELSERID